MLCHLCYLRELLLLQVLCDRGLKVFGVALVQAVNLASFLDLYVPIDQDKLSDGLTDRRRHGNWHQRVQNPHSRSVFDRAY